MNAFTPSASNETSLGWNHMPAYGEVMSELKGLNHLDIHAPLAPEPAPTISSSSRSGIA